jgi:ribose 5-phosphate isomerase A
VDEHLNAIKGGGACQLREKVLAEAAKTWIIVADYRKNSTVLGKTWTQGVPIEVAEFAWSRVQRQLTKMGSTAATLRMGKMKAGPVVTDNGWVAWVLLWLRYQTWLTLLFIRLLSSNFVIDATFSQAIMKDPRDLLQRIKLLTGVIEVGLFVDMCEAAYFGNEDGTITSKSKDGSIKEGIVFDVFRNPLLS